MISTLYRAETIAGYSIVLNLAFVVSYFPYDGNGRDQGITSVEMVNHNTWYISVPFEDFHTVMMQLEEADNA